MNSWRVQNARTKSFWFKNQGGQHIVELVVGLLILVPLVLFLLDLSVLVLSGQLADRCAKAAARAAANQGDSASALTAAKTALNQAGKGGFVSFDPNSAVTIDYQPFDNTNLAPGRVSVLVKGTCNLPVPVPLLGNGFNNKEIQAQAVEPVVTPPTPFVPLGKGP